MMIRITTKIKSVLRLVNIHVQTKIYENPSRNLRYPANVLIGPCSQFNFYEKCFLFLTN